MMLMLVLFCALVPGMQETELKNKTLDRTITASLSGAVSCFLQQRSGGHWGQNTPRAIVALNLASDVVPIQKPDRDVYEKHLNILLSLELRSDFIGESSLGLSRLALFINALMSSCQDPRSFHGMNLVEELRSRTDSTPMKFRLPIAFVSLCFNDRVEHQDMVHLRYLFEKEHAEKPDLQALDLMAMSCITQKRKFQSFHKTFIKDLIQYFNNNQTLANVTNVYKKALRNQIINMAEKFKTEHHRGLKSFVKERNLTQLLEYQEPDGCFGSFLATYYMIPVIAGNSLLDIVQRSCHHASKAQSSAVVTAPGIFSKIHFSVWIGDGAEKDSHSVTLSLSGNKTLLDVMVMAEQRSPVFRFNYEVIPARANEIIPSKSGAQVFSISGIPNDAERQIYWTLYKTKDSNTRGKTWKLELQNVSTGVNNIFPKENDHYIFWLKRM